jgi:Predicted hydrolases or acyltransferases (alpha/beta hydrolase superfamily)
MPRPLLELGSRARAELPGSFVRLTRGFVHYELSGPEGGPVLVLVGGLSVPYATWDRNAAALAASGYRLLRYDHYGRGYSDRPRVRYGLDLYVEQLVELVATLDLALPVRLVGLSMGGPVVAAATVRHPNLVRAVALVDPLFEWPAPTGASRMLGLPGLGDALMAFNGTSILAAGQRGDFSSQAEYEAFLPSYLSPLEYRGIPRAVLATMRDIPRWPLGELYAELGRSGPPSLLFWGREDRTLPFEQSGRLLERLTQTEFLPIDGAGHVPQWERPEIVNAALSEFFGRVS